MPKHPDLSSALLAAPALLGWELVHNSPEGITAGYIVETEAYNATDAASHSFRGQGIRNQVMFGPAGHLYVYFTYGMHYCVNIVTGEAGSGEGVLIRALEPSRGLALMEARRPKASGTNLTNGPAKLAQAMGLGRLQNGAPLFADGPLGIRPGFKPAAITRSTRVGISQAREKPWRFYVTGNKFVSKP